MPEPLRSAGQPAGNESIVKLAALPRNSKSAAGRTETLQILRVGLRPVLGFEACPVSGALTVSGRNANVCLMGSFAAGEPVHRGGGSGLPKGSGFFHFRTVPKYKNP